MPTGLTRKCLGTVAFLTTLALISPHASAQVSQKPGGATNPFNGYDPLAACASEFDRQISAMDAYLRALGSRGSTDAQWMRNQLRTTNNSLNMSCDASFLRRMPEFEASVAEADQRVARQASAANDAKSRAEYEQTRAAVEVQRCMVRAIKQRIAQYCSGAGESGTSAQRPALQPPSPPPQASRSPSPEPGPRTPAIESRREPELSLARTALLDAIREESSTGSKAHDRDIRPVYGLALATARKAHDADAHARKAKVHNNANDATQCMKVERTGVREEWGTQGRYRIVNTCGFPVAASWCVDEMECASGRGSLWTIQPGTDWPIFFADPNNPVIRVGACKAGAASTPLPSDAELARAGGINARHNDPPAAPGVGRMLGHTCE